ncbi:hypothetical protein L0668_04065 [Paraglaciecola aquimarina]|uniref:DUF4340 domain-containing protein n=1 Tax=Paraglaciecola algarum TaxID=3050085 RepID=A0ABS9D2Y3_9ALTE|nr:hypothetical protein [Paraglaciecola sp. G1-23]MCF2947270.1 hypothetical protein [Paraglaciecola sp. G1-23]
MIRLSQRGWNNVIIFTTLILIMLFNFSSDFLNRNVQDKPEISTLIPAGLVITTIEYQNDKIERIGQGWRAKSGKLSHEQLTQLVANWQNAEVELFDDQLNWQSDVKTISVWFAGQVKPITYSFLFFADKTLVKTEQKINQQTYQLVNPDFSQLNIDH